MGDPQRRLTLAKQSRLGVTRQPMRVSNRPIPVPIERLLCTPRLGPALEHLSPLVVVLTQQLASLSIDKMYPGAGVGL